MRTRNDKKELTRMLKRRGAQQTPDVSASVTEIRSCGVMGRPEPLGLNTVGLLGGLVILWEFELEFDDLEAFGKFLDDNEAKIGTAIGQSPNASYHGTYMLHAGGTPRFRTVWAYRSLDDMVAFWDAAMSNDDQKPLVKAVKTLRAYWLLDPNRSEARWLPARLQLDQKDHGDAFAKLTRQAYDVSKTLR